MLTHINLALTLEEELSKILIQFKIEIGEETKIFKFVFVRVSLEKIVF